MSMLRKIAATSLITLSLALTSIATVTPALAHGGHGGGGHDGGGHRGGASMSSHMSGGMSRSGFSGRDHFAGRVHEDNDDNYYYDQCLSPWSRDRLAVRSDVCS